MANVTLSWAANPATDNISRYQVWGANGTSTVFGSCTLLASIAGLTWTDTGLPNNQARTYYIVAVNAVGSASPEGPINITTAAPSSAYVQNAGGALSVQEGTHASRPAFGNAGALYVETDTGSIFRDTGTAWSQLATSGGGGSGGTKGAPGGRLTLVTGTPVPTSDQTAKSTVFYTPYVGTDIPIWSGSAWADQTFAELTLSLDTTNHVASACYDVFVWNNAGTISVGTGPAWNYSSTVTFSGNLVSWTAHGLNMGDPVVFTTTGTLPTGITAGTVYYVIPNAANSFSLASTLANANAGTAITLTGAGTGTNTGTSNTRSRGTGAGTTELQLKDGIWTNKNSITLKNGAGAGTAGIAANTATYAGTFYTTAAGQTGDSFAGRYVWNCYNRVNRVMRIRESTNSWTYGSAAWRIMNNNTANALNYIVGLDDEPIYCQVAGLGQCSLVANLAVGVGADSNNTNSAWVFGHGVPANVAMQMVGTYDDSPGLGKHSLYALEYGNASGTTTFYGNAGLTNLQSGIIGRVRG